MTPTQREAAERLADWLQDGADDPMWANHAEMSKTTLGRTAALLRELLAEPQRKPLTDRQIDDIWIKRDCMEAISAGDLLAQVRCTVRAAERFYGIGETQ